MAKFIKSKFRVLWSTIFTFFAGIFSLEAIAQDASDDNSEDRKMRKLKKMKH